MSRNNSLNKMSMIEIANRLNRIQAKSRSRLQFPTKVQSKKHYFDYHTDGVILGQDQNKLPPIMKSIKNNMDISDIEGTKPRVIEKQKNVMNYYKNKNEEYNPFAPTENNLGRSASQPKILTRHQGLRLHTDSLDDFQSQSVQKLKLYPQSKRQITEPSLATYQSEILTRKLISQNKFPAFNNDISYKKMDNVSQRKGIAFNPTFLSSFMLV